MRKESLFTFKGLYRENFEVEGYRFGGGEKSACIIGALRGNEIQQMYICSLLIKALKELESHGAISHNHEILVVPTGNILPMLEKDSGLLIIQMLTEDFREIRKVIRWTGLHQCYLRRWEDIITVSSLPAFICREISFPM